MMNFAEKLLPAPVNGGFRDDNYWIWCGSVIKGEDGLYHMFASLWEKDVPFAPNWVTNSRVVRAVSKTAAGPYQFAEDILPPRGNEYWDGMMTHNPTIHKYGDTYLLYYTGTTYQSDLPDRDHPVSSDLRIEARRNQRIGLAVSKSIYGPWTRPDRPIIDIRPGKWDAFLTTNAAPCVMPDGKVYCYYKSTQHNTDTLKYGLAMADSWDTEYKRLHDSPILWHNDPTITYEDAYVWYQDDKFHMIFNDMSGRLTGEHHAGAIAASNDAINWELANPPKAYSRAIKWDDGTETKQGSFERPQLLIEDGKPTHLFAATADGKGWSVDARNTWNMVVPLQ